MKTLPMACCWECRSRFSSMKQLLISVLLLITVSAAAETLLTEQQALKIVFPKSENVVSEVKILTSQQREELQKRSGLRFPEREYKFFIGKSRGADDGYALIMNEIGKHEYITFIVGVSTKGEVGDVAITEYRESRGGEVREQRFLRQFHGKRAKDSIQVNNDIVNYTGATLSSYAIARGVKKALLLVQTFYAAGGQNK
jgi:Na+-translocating ferredoxin:NAD+ oxidoreductase RnfG subunit